MMTDPIADMLTRIRNAQMARKARVMIPFSKVKMAVLDILIQEGYIEATEKQDGTPVMLNVTLKYRGTQPMITNIKRESKPGHRMYRKADEMPRILNGYGIAIVSTSKGIMTVKNAQKHGIGGEILCSIY
jgi:small subunit ribosomal protein S8